MVHQIINKNKLTFNICLVTALKTFIQHLQMLYFFFVLEQIKGNLSSYCTLKS